MGKRKDVNTVAVSFVTAFISAQIAEEMSWLLSARIAALKLAEITIAETAELK